jgi:DNA-binding NtrC family response regulator
MGATIEVAPLRERREDILPLFAHFIGSELACTSDCAEALAIYPWRYNVREVEQVARALGPSLTASSSTLDLMDLPAAIRAPVEARLDRVSMASVVPLALKVRRDAPPNADELAEVIRHFDGNIAHVAEYFGKDRKQIYRWCEKLGVERNELA